jgi:hypothetical protein
VHVKHRLCHFLPAPRTCSLKKTESLQRGHLADMFADCFGDRRLPVIIARGFFARRPRPLGGAPVRPVVPTDTDRVPADRAAQQASR